MIDGLEPPRHGMSQEPDTTQTTQRTLLSSGPARPERRSACVVVIHGEGLGKRADIGDREVIVGRSQEADLPIPHKSVSRQHCRIWRDGEDYRIADLGATNTTRINDEPVAEAVLRDGDQITLGESILKFISHSSVEALYHEEVYQLATHDALTELCRIRRRGAIRGTCSPSSRSITRGSRRWSATATCRRTVSRATTTATRAS